MTANPNQQTDLRKVLYQCRLGRDDLERVFAMACEGIESPTIKVSTVSGSTRFWEGNLADLVATVQSQPTEAGDEWTNLSLEAAGPGRERLVSITIDSERTEYNVSGSDAVWAYGQAARLDSFLGNKGAVTQSPKYETKMSLAFVLFFLVVGAFFLLADSGPDTVSECLAQTRKAKEGAPLVNSLFAALLAIGLTGAIAPIVKRRALRARLQVHSNIPTGGWWSRLSTGERIAAIGVPIAVVAAIGATMSGFSDVFGT